MHAHSLVIGVRELDRQVEDLLERRRLCQQVVRASGLQQLSTLCTLDCLVAASTPLPVPKEAKHEADTLVETLLEYLQREGTLTRSILDQSQKVAIAETARVAEVGSAVVIPLGSQGVAKYNWRPVFRLVADSLEDIASKSDRLLARVQAEPFPAVLSRIWESNVAMLRESQNTVKTILARQERLQRLYGRPPDEPADFGRWTLEKLTRSMS